MKIFLLLLRLFEISKVIKSKLQIIILSKKNQKISIGYDCTFSYSNIILGKNVHIGSNANFISRNSKIIISDYVMFGPNVTIRGGDHRIDIIGKHIYEVKENEKLSKNDKDVVIEEGVWVGCNVTILKGVIIGKGSVVAAGSVVTKSVPPYTIVAGNPARVIKERFSICQIVEHEKILKNRNVNY